jgi:hypothetical protein
MAKNEKTRIAVNRVVSFLAGGLLVFAVMNLSVVSGAKALNKDLAKQLDVAVNEPARLLNDAKAQFKDQDYTKARETLSTLFTNRPGSEQAVEGKLLDATIVAAVTKADSAWEAASAGVKARWAKEKSTDLRSKADSARDELEKGIPAAIDQEWEKSKDQIRKDWELKG